VGKDIQRWLAKLAFAVNEHCTLSDTHSQRMPSSASQVPPKCTITHTINPDAGGVRSLRSNSCDYDDQSLFEDDIESNNASDLEDAHDVPLHSSQTEGRPKEKDSNDASGQRVESPKDSNKSSLEVHTLVCKQQYLTLSRFCNDTIGFVGPMKVHSNFKRTIRNNICKQIKPTVVPRHVNDERYQFQM